MILSQNRQIEGPFTASLQKFIGLDTAKEIARMKVWILATVLGLSALPAIAQDRSSKTEDDFGASTPRKMTAKEVFSGKPFPLNVKLKDIDSDWRVFNALNAVNNQTLVNLYGLSGNGIGLNSSFTKGEEVTLGSETFIVAYRPRVKLPSMTAISSSALDAHAFDSMKLTDNTVMSLSLINLRTTGAISDIRPFDRNEFLAQNEEASPNGVKTAPLESGSPSDSASTVVSLNNLRQLGQAVSMYAQDYDEVLPSMKSASKFKEVVLPYVKNEKVFINPMTRTPYAMNEILSQHKLAHILKPAEMAVIYEAELAPDGTRGVCFLDGHVSRVDDAEWTLIKKRSKIK